MSFKILAALTIASVAWAAEESKLTKDGGFWVQTITGSDTAVPHGRLRVSTRGSVTFRGGPDDQLQYTVTKRVKASSAAEARRLLQRFLVKVYRQGDVSFVTVAHGGDGGSAELNLIVPRSMRESFLEVHGGAINGANLNGAVQVETDGGAIKLDKIAGPVSARTAGGEITLGTVGSWVRCTSAGGPIRAESIGGQAELETAAGDITLGDVGGPLRASTAGGAIHITRAASSVALNTAGGAIDVGSAKGMVTAGNSSGPIRVGAANGVECETGGGGIRLSNVTGALRASTVVGNVVAQLLAGGSPGESFLVTGLGDITVFIPSNLGIRILAQIDSNGRIVSDFPAVRSKAGARQPVAEGDINGGGPLLRLSSTNGTIYIRRQK